MSEAANKAEILLESLPYIRKFSGATFVIKFGGSILASSDAKESFCKDIALLKYVGINPIIVHGGGKEIDAWQKRLGLERKFVDGLRVTDPETMEITEMVLSGKVNRDLVSCLNRVGAKAVGLSGKDAHLFLAQRRKKDGVDLGQVGKISEVNTEIFESLIPRYIPVISSIAVSSLGETLNINADEAATAIACALGVAKLIYLTDVDGLFKNDTLISSLTLVDAEEMMQDPSVTGGMLPKLEASIKALKNQVGSVHMLNGNSAHAVLLEIFTDAGVGTVITHT